jgi:hypothetical protein
MRPDICRGYVRSKKSYTTEQALIRVVRGDDYSPAAAAGTPCGAIVRDDLASAQRGWFHPAFNSEIIRGRGDDRVCGVS